MERTSSHAHELRGGELHFDGGRGRKGRDDPHGKSEGEEEKAGMEDERDACGFGVGIITHRSIAAARGWPKKLHGMVVRSDSSSVNIPSLLINCSWSLVKQSIHFASNSLSP